MATKPTKAEWEQVEERLNNFYSPVAFICDGFHVHLRLTRMNQFKNAICVYVDGSMRLTHKADTEEVLRFSCPSTRFVMPAKHRANFKKLSKRDQAYMLKTYGEVADPTRTFTVYTPFWGSFKALKAALIKHNESVELLKTYNYEVKVKS